MRRVAKIFIWCSLIPICLILIVLLTVSAYGAFLYFQADVKQPELELLASDYTLSHHTDSLRVCGSNSLLKNKFGLWETILRGSSVDRGATYGAMATDLLYYQEKVFVDKIKQIIPSDAYLRFLHVILKVFNRDMASYISSEHREEIYGVSLFCTHEYDVFGSPYERQFYYHAAHDIGHMMQEYMLVGCSSFATWGTRSENETLIVGRNFDFWVGDDFAKNKQVNFVFPEDGYKYASISWPGMTGVVSGMNEKGLTVTMNASKGEIPLSSAMPIAILAKEILLHAENIQEAYEIAKKYSTFVSESLLVSSASDGIAAIIEKTPEKIDILYPQNESMICTNHYQSDAFKNDRINIDNINTSDSKYRYERLEELLSDFGRINVESAALILRDRFGKLGKDIGLANEMALNQSIAHHSVIFTPKNLKMWVSTDPWQSGAYVCYDLYEIFQKESAASQSLIDYSHIIDADSSYINNIYPRVLKHRQLSTVIRNATSSNTVLEGSIIEDYHLNNPEFYETYSILGDYYEMSKDYGQALKYWNIALNKELPRAAYKEELLKKISRYDKK